MYNESAAKLHKLQVISPLVGFKPLDKYSYDIGQSFADPQIRPSFIPTRCRFLTAALPESSPQGTGIDFPNTLSLLLSRMDESNIANTTKITNLLHKRIRVRAE